MNLLKRPAFETYVATHQGKVRGNNEDAVSPLLADAKEPWGWGVAVADGVGGGSAGEVASHTVVDRLRERLAMWYGNPSATGNAWARTARKHLGDLVVNLHSGLRMMAEKDPTLVGFSSTLVGLLAFRDRVAVLHCGDSRAYLYREGWIHPLTRDHTWEEDQRRRGELSAADIEASPNRAALMQALGGTRDVTPDVSFHEIREGDVLLACSDGLTKYLTDSDLGRELQSPADLEVVGQRLIAMALEGGGGDNISVGLIRVRKISGAPLPRVPDEVLGEPQEGVRALPGSARQTELSPTARPKRARRRWSRRRRVLVTLVALAAVGMSATAFTLWQMSTPTMAGGAGMGMPMPASPGATAHKSNGEKGEFKQQLAGREHPDAGVPSESTNGANEGILATLATKVGFGSSAKQRRAPPNGSASSAAPVKALVTAGTSAIGPPTDSQKVSEGRAAEEKARRVQREADSVSHAEELRKEREQNARVTACLKDEVAAGKRYADTKDILEAAKKTGGKKARTRESAATEQKAADVWLESLAGSGKWKLEPAQKDTAKWNRIVRAYDAFDAAGKNQDEVTKRCVALQP